jgi:UTP pyrophosphatase
MSKASDPLKYINHYSPSIVEQVKRLVDQNSLEHWFEKRYSEYHQIKTDKALLSYAMSFKNTYMKKSAPLSKVIYDPKIHLVKNALGLHTTISRVQGNKLKSKNEIRIAEMFRHAPEPLLRMLVVHELAHLKEREHDKAFYQLCCHMEPDYHQLEFDARVFLILQELA